MNVAGGLSALSVLSVIGSLSVKRTSEKMHSFQKCPRTALFICRQFKTSADKTLHYWCTLLPQPSSLTESPPTVTCEINADRLWFQLRPVELQRWLANNQRATASSAAVTQQIKRLQQKQRWHAEIHKEIKVCTDDICTLLAHLLGDLSVWHSRVWVFETSALLRRSLEVCRLQNPHYRSNVFAHSIKQGESSQVTFQWLWWNRLKEIH